MSPLNLAIHPFNGKRVCAVRNFGKEGKTADDMMMTTQGGDGVVNS